MASPTKQEASSSLPRTGAVLCPDWSVIAALNEADISAVTPAAIVHDRRIVGLSASARTAGVRPYMRQRDAQANCPDLQLLSPDEGRDARLFELVVDAVEDLVAEVQVLRPGLCVFLAGGPARYAGGEERLAEQLVEHIAMLTGFEAFVGFAEGVFATTLAAAQPAIVAPGHTQRFLATIDVATLNQPALVSVLERCGIRTFGQLVALGEQNVVTRFGADGAIAYRLASGCQETLIVARTPAVHVEKRMELDPPAEQIQVATAAVHTLAERFTAMVVNRGLACTVLRINATTESDVLSRTWRAEEVFSAAQIAARLRWQLEAWLTSPRRPTSGVSELRLIAEQVVAAGRMQLGLWGGSGASEQRMRRAADQAQDTLGIHAVTTATAVGARVPKAQTHHLPWRDESALKSPELPWPDAMPAPPLLLPHPEPVGLYTANQLEVRMSARHVLSALPATLHRPGEKPITVVNCAGLWPLHEHWWETTHRGAWLQIVVATGEIESALLLFSDETRWWLVGSYD